MAQGVICPSGALDVHFPHDVLGELDSAEVGRISRIQYGLREEVLVTVAVTFLVGCIAASPNRSPEGCSVQQQPAFDVWLRDRSNDSWNWSAR